MKAKRITGIGAALVKRLLQEQGIVPTTWQERHARRRAATATAR